MLEEEKRGTHAATRVCVCDGSNDCAGDYDMILLCARSARARPCLRLRCYYYECVCVLGAWPLV